MSTRALIGALGALALFFLVPAAPAFADRLGGAYRGPDSENVVPREEISPDLPKEAPPADDPADRPTGDSSSGGDEGQCDGVSEGGASSGESSGDDPSPGSGEGGGSEGEGGDGSYRGPSGDTPPPPPSDRGPSDPPPSGGSDSGSTGEGSSSQPSSPPPQTAPPSGGGDAPGLTGTGTAGKAGRKPIEDPQAFWPHWFENNKEWLLAELLEARNDELPIPARSSVRWCDAGDGTSIRSPVTEREKRDLVLPALTEGLYHPSSWVRDAAVLALGKLGTPQVVDMIAGKLNDPDPDVCEDALLALGLTGQSAAFPHLEKHLAGKESLKPFAALGLGLLGDPLALDPLVKEFDRALDAGRIETTACTAVAIGLLGDETQAERLGRVIVDPRQPSRLKVYVCQALGRIGGDESRKWLLRSLSAKDRATQAAAILALSECGDETVVRTLMGSNGLKSGDRMTRLFAVVALARIAGRDEPKSRVYRTVAGELRKYAENPVRDQYLSTWAALALAIMGEDGSNGFFEDRMRPEQLSKGTEETRAAMAMALGLSKDKNAARSLRTIVSRANLEDGFRGYSAIALGLIRDNASHDTLRKTLERTRRKEILRSGCWALGLLGDRKDLDWLIDTLGTDDTGRHTVRGAAAIGIGLIGDRMAVVPLVRMATADSSSSNRAFAIAALGCLVDRSPTPRLAQLFSSTNYRQQLPVVKEVLMSL